MFSYKRRKVFFRCFYFIILSINTHTTLYTYFYVHNMKHILKVKIKKILFDFIRN